MCGRSCFSILSTLLVLSGCSSLNGSLIDGAGRTGNVPEIAPVPTNNTASIDTNNYVECVQPAISWISKQRITYPDPAQLAVVNDEWRDCSGNFLRLSSRIATVCEGLNMVAPPGIKPYEAAGGKKRPAPAEARTTRGIAKWYDEKGLFTPVYYDNTELTRESADLKRIRNRIKNGSVLWFSRKQPLEANGKSALYNEGSGIINHMGTVFDVKRDVNDDVISWKMYHGQNNRKHNKVTSHTWVWPEKFTSRGQKYPPGGYWDQRIVGFADYIVPPVVSP